MDVKIDSLQLLSTEIENDMLPLRVYAKNPRILLSSFLTRCGFWIPDKWYLQLLYFLNVGKPLNLRNPLTFSEKIQWLKLYNRRPEYTLMVDKYAVKDYVAGIIGQEYIIPTLCIWDCPEMIDFNTLPQQFVLKTTHGGGSCGVLICKDITLIDKRKIIKQLKKASKQNLYKSLREWPYKDVPKRIIAEKYLESENGVLDDYKILCFSGKAKLIEYHANRFGPNHTQDFYDTSWNKTSLSQGGINTVSDFVVDRPICFDKMLRLSESLAKGIPMCRIDWYIVNQKLYFGEITFFDASGFEPFDREEDEIMLGSWIDLSLCN